MVPSLTLVLAVLGLPCSLLKFWAAKLEAFQSLFTSLRPIFKRSSEKAVSVARREVEAQ